MCNVKVSRGSDNPKYQSLSGLSSHLKTNHPQITETNQAKMTNFTATDNCQSESEPVSKKRKMQIFDIKSKKQRADMLQCTIPGWVDTNTKIDTNSEKGQKFHKSIFEMILLDIQPWSVVNDPGFLRHHALIAPNYEIGNEKYYRSMLNPTYEKVKDAMKNLLKEKHADTVSISLDAWSSFHHGYLGMTVHFISENWERVKFCLACSKFDEKHTASNIFQKIENTAQDWDLSDKIKVCLRDNAANVKAAFNEPGCVYKSAGCLNHSLQLVIKKELFCLQSVEDLIQKCRKLCTHASHSNSFYSELYKQQDVQMKNSNRLGLKNDVATRWNSTFYMLERILKLKSAIAATLLNLPSCGIEFSAQDWNICKKLVEILGVFEEATKMLSGSDTCISSCIPIVTTIIKSLEIRSGDNEMMEMKEALKKAMEVRFIDLETTEHYAVATLLDPRFKTHFFRSQIALQKAKSIVLSELDYSKQNQEELVPVSRNPSAENVGFSSMMKKIIAQSQSALSQTPSLKLAKEILDDFLESPISTNSLAFWKEYEKNSTSEIKLALARIAKKFLTPPPTSTEVERLFSTAGDVLSNERNRLLPENLEKMLFCRENLPIINFKY